MKFNLLKNKITFLGRGAGSKLRPLEPKCVCSCY